MFALRYKAVAAIALTAVLTGCASGEPGTGMSSRPLGYDAGHFSGAEEAPEHAPSLALPTSSPIVGPAPGSFKRINLASGRNFLVNLPQDYSDERAWPLVLAFHGWQETSWDMYSYTELGAAEAITVFPEGVDKAWAPAPYASTTGEEDIQFVRDIVDSLRATYRVDDARIYATGMSNGGGFAAYLACQAPELVTAVATISAAYYDKILEGCADVPVGRLDMHGTDDPVVNYYGGRRHDTHYESVTNVLAQDQRRNQCSNSVDTSRLVNNALFMQWKDCQAPLQHIRIGGGKHVWPGGTYDTGNAEGRGFATDKVLDFFSIPGRAAQPPS